MIDNIAFIPLPADFYPKDQFSDGKLLEQSRY